MKYIFAFLLVLFFKVQAFAYSNFISHGYASCLTCHYNALGNGPLNDYGRGVSATAISSRIFYGKNTEEQVISDRSNFFFGAMRDQKWFRPSINVRGLRYTRNFLKGDSISKNILMQAEGNIVIRPVEKDKLFFTATYGYAPTPQTSRNNPLNKQKNVISREHYMQATIAKNHRLYLGFMDKAFGLRIPDHMAFSRSVPGVAQNDQSHGLIYHYYNNNYEFAGNLFAGNLYQDKDLRQKGFSTFFEYEIASKTRVGASILYSQNKYLKNIINSFHLRVGFGDGASLISEIGQVTKKPIDSEILKSTGVYSFSQANMQIVRGLDLLTTFEYYKSDISTSSANTNYKFGVGLQIFPIQRMEVRFDLVNSRIISTTTVIPDSLDFMTQVHLWF